MTIYFDMDGTIANLYAVENWLPKLRNEDASPYTDAEPLVRLATLARLLNPKIRVIGAYLPTARMLNVMKNGMTHAVDFSLLLTIVAEASIVLGCSMGISVLKRRWSE